MLLVLFSSVLLLVLFLGLYWIKKVRRFQHLNRFPGPKPSPILGNIHELGANLTDVFNTMLRLSKEYGSTFKIYMGPCSVNLIVTEPIHVEHFLSSNRHINRSGFYDYFKPFLGHSLTCTKGDNWKERREQLSFICHDSFLENCMMVCNSASADLIKTLQENADKNFNCEYVINNYALSIICDSVIGTSSKSDLAFNQAYMDALQSLMSIAMGRTCSIVERSNFLFRFTNNYRKQNKYLKIVRDFSDDIIAKTRSHNEAEDNFLRVLLGLEEKGLICKGDVKDEVNNLLITGYNTVASSISFFLYELSKHPKIQDRIYEEALSILGPNFNNNFATIKDLDSMKYLKKCVKEMLRLYTVIPFFDRELAHREILGKLCQGFQGGFSCILSSFRWNLDT